MHTPNDATARRTRRGRRRCRRRCCVGRYQLTARGPSLHSLHVAALRAHRTARRLGDDGHSLSTHSSAADAVPNTNDPRIRPTTPASARRPTSPTQHRTPPAPPHLHIRPSHPCTTSNPSAVPWPAAASALAALAAFFEAFFSAFLALALARAAATAGSVVTCTRGTSHATERRAVH